MLDEFKIVPVLIGEANNDQIVEVLNKLWYDKETLVGWICFRIPELVYS